MAVSSHAAGAAAATPQTRRPSRIAGVGVSASRSCPSYRKAAAAAAGAFAAATTSSGITGAPGSPTLHLPAAAPCRAGKIRRHVAKVRCLREFAEPKEGTRSPRQVREHGAWRMAGRCIVELVALALRGFTRRPPALPQYLHCCMKLIRFFVYVAHEE
uniref:Uncharacterized protein n=1 Tax=Oryza sativa subsp. japonica TaxID=39947 RepID=Q6K809_ORYSJ|nr:hypothetical protein [Oryza sativa Japonica Group]